jgi:hypothetical protein
LQEAMKIFTSMVQEPFLQVQAYNEMACCYRAKYPLLIQTNASKHEMDFTLDQAVLYFERAINSAREQGYFVEELDSLQDLAVIYFRARNIIKASSILDEVEGKIFESAPQYRIVAGSRLPKPSEKDTDAFFKILGQVQMLRGAIERIKIDTPVASLPGYTKQLWINVAQHYVFAIVYFNMFSGEKFVQSHIYARMHLRFKDCNAVLSREIVEQYIPRWIKEFRLPKEILSKSFEDVFGLFEN